MSIYRVTCSGPARSRWTGDGPARRFDHMEMLRVDGSVGHQFDLLADDAEEALGRVTGALEFVGRFSEFKVAAIDPSPGGSDPAWGQSLLEGFDRPARAILQALRTGPMPEWVLLADPVIGLTDETLAAALATLSDAGVVQPAGQLAPSDHWWTLTASARRRLSGSSPE